MKIILTFALIVAISFSGFSQSAQKSEIENPGKTYTYAYVRIQGKAFSKKLKVEVDFGDTPEQQEASEQYSEVLTNKKSFAAVLNYMASNKFELVQTLELTESFQGSGGTSGIVFIMRKKED